MAIDFKDFSILIVDDYRTMLKVIHHFLKQLGFQNIEEAYDGNSAIEKIKDRKYDLIISDWNMEPGTGLDLLQHIRSQPNLSDTPFIMITSENRSDTVKAARDAGVDNYILKPFNISTLKEKLVSVLGEF